MMGSRIVWGGRTRYASRNWQAPRHPTAPTDMYGDKFDPAPIPADSPESPLRIGVPYHCPEDDVVYRVVHRLRPDEGWCTARFWLDRYDCDMGLLLMFVSRGWLDAAFESASPTKRYRCRDETPILRYLAINRPKHEVKR